MKLSQLLKKEGTHLLADSKFLFYQRHFYKRRGTSEARGDKSCIYLIKQNFTKQLMCQPLFWSEVKHIHGSIMKMS